MFNEADKAAYLKARRDLGPKVTIEDAVRFYNLHHPLDTLARTVPAIVAEMLIAKRQAGLSAAWVTDLETRLGRFKKAFSGPLGEVTGPAIEDWLRIIGGSQRTRKNYHTAVSVLISFAKARKYLAKAFDELSGVGRGRDSAARIEIFTPDQMRRLLAACPERHLPYLVLGGFAGIRTREIQRLDWADVHQDRGHIEIRPENAKTRARRLVPIVPNLAAWLRPGKGPVWPYDRAKRFLRATRNAKGMTPEEREALKWKRNALRHSFISYRLALVKSAGQVALECGTSERKIFTNYREVVTEAAAREWFSISPQGHQKRRKSKKGQQNAKP